MLSIGDWSSYVGPAYYWRKSSAVIAFNHIRNFIWHARQPTTSCDGGSLSVRDRSTRFAETVGGRPQM